MPYVNLNISEDQLLKATKIASLLGLNRSAYFRKAIEHYNKRIERELLAQQFKMASEKCREESLSVCKEFDRIDNIPE
ncbi:MAG: hypothetical protein ONB44_23185 [candidate division KSB1 bacterium]|nr:hypothetical protein [candidate division KSB1 bacterium]MDZ7305045.1 hypothetical protein [candidate division KSB1 bacterium]MDZ7312891.1 hypothetical protein [candidate division KSB1 bacterium]